MTPADRGKAPKSGASAPFRALSERRIDPGTPRREAPLPPSPLSAAPPKGRDQTGIRLGKVRGK